MAAVSILNLTLLVLPTFGSAAVSVLDLSGTVSMLYTPRIERVRICISARFDFESSVPMEHPRNIINRGDIEVEAIQNLMEKIVSSSKEDGASAGAGAEAVDEDAVDMEENDVTI
eukprot:scaffold30191_cov162-Skeletonema_marinoi.AAC.1